MAIQFARARVISPTGRRPRSAVAASAYNGRGVGVDENTGERFDFRNRGADLVDSGFLLPKDAPEWAADMQRLWNAATEAEKVTDRKTKERRFSQNGNPQVARELVLALPKELTDEQNRDLALAYIADRHDGPGGQKVAIQWAIHRDPEGKNPHLHLMESTRELTGKGFGKKDRRLNPEFNKGQIVPDELGKRWANFQNGYFQERGFKLEVDPTRIIPDRHMGKAFYVEEETKRQEQRDQLEQENWEAARDPEKVLEHVTSHKATFNVFDIERHLEKSGLDEFERLEVRTAILNRADLVEVDRQRYTTQAVIDQEQAVLGYADKLRVAGKFGIGEEASRAALAARTMDAEQVEAFEVATKSNSIAIIQGRAGTGKSYTMGAIRDAYEAEGFRVVGLAPTNAVAADMRSDGFKEGRTIASEMLRQQNEREVWDHRTVIVVDEMGMVSTRDMERLLARAEATGSKVIGFGDDRQLQSVERGGMFPLLAERAPSTELKTVRRQSEGWMREASEAAAGGNIKAAVKTYEERGNVHWSEDVDKARGELVKDWKAAAGQGAMPAVYASTNAQVNALNEELRLARKELGQLGQLSHVFEVEKRDEKRTIMVSNNDRIIFTSSTRDRATGLDLRNGEAGTITKIEGGKITVRTDGDKGRTFTFDATENKGWALGYASTVYKGQGKTNGKAWVLHDNKFAWNSSTAYVGLTRHKEDFRLYANREMTKDVEELGSHMGRAGHNGAASSYMNMKVDELAKVWSADELTPAADQQEPSGSVADRLAALRGNERGKTSERAQVQREGVADRLAALRGKDREAIERMAAEDAENLRKIMEAVRSGKSKGVQHSADKSGYEGVMKRMKDRDQQDAQRAQERPKQVNAMEEAERRSKAAREPENGAERDRQAEERKRRKDRDFGL